VADLGERTGGAAVNRAALEHIIRAAAVISGDDEIIVIGSQAVLGSFPNAPAAMLLSDEADVYPKNFPERADLIEGSIGELSPFHMTFGYYAEGASEETASLPVGWQARLVRVQNPNTRGATGLCLDVHDLVAAKLVAGREKDSAYAAAALGAKLVDLNVLLDRIATINVDDRLRHAASERAQSLVG